MVYWGTPKVKATLEVSICPQAYRERIEIQENSFKRMIDHGALDINYGRKKLVGPNLHQQRKRADLETSVESAQQRPGNKTNALRQPTSQG